MKKLSITYKLISENLATAWKKGEYLFKNSNKDFLNCHHNCHKSYKKKKKLSIKQNFEVRKKKIVSKSTLKLINIWNITIKIFILTVIVKFLKKLSITHKLKSQNLATAWKRSKYLLKNSNKDFFKLSS